MSITATISGIIAIAKAIPAAERIFDKFYEMYTDYRIQKIDTAHITAENKRDLLNKKIQGAVNDEEIKVLSSMLHDYNNS